MATKFGFHYPSRMHGTAKLAMFGVVHPIGMEFEAKRLSPRYLSHFARSTQKHKICDIWCCMTTAHSLSGVARIFQFPNTQQFLLFRDEILGSLAMFLCSTNTAFRWFGCRVTLAPQNQESMGNFQLDVRGLETKKLIHQQAFVRLVRRDLWFWMSNDVYNESKIPNRPKMGFHRGQGPQVWPREETSASSRDVQICPKWHSLLLVWGGKNLWKYLKAKDTYRIYRHIWKALPIGPNISWQLWPAQGYETWLAGCQGHGGHGVWVSRPSLAPPKLSSHRSPYVWKGIKMA